MFTALLFVSLSPAFGAGVAVDGFVPTHVYDALGNQERRSLPPALLVRLDLALRDHDHTVFVHLPVRVAPAVAPGSFGFTAVFHQFTVDTIKGGAEFSARVGRVPEIAAGGFAAARLPWLSASLLSRGGLSIGARGPSFDIGLQGMAAFFGDSVRVGLSSRTKIPLGHDAKGSWSFGPRARWRTRCGFADVFVHWRIRGINERGGVLFGVRIGRGIPLGFSTYFDS